MSAGERDGLGTMRSGLQGWYPAASPALCRPAPGAFMSNDQFRQPLSWIEHFLHLNLTLITSGLWGFVWYHRAKKGRVGGPADLVCRHCGGYGLRWTTHGLNRVQVPCTH
jgi:hypothetical protein